VSLLQLEGNSGYILFLWREECEDSLKSVAEYVSNFILQIYSWDLSWTNCVIMLKQTTRESLH
jgi:hypothetical protein